MRFAGVTVVDDVSFDIDAGGRLGIIGESGSGKTLSALSVIGLVPEQAEVIGSVRFDGQELIGLADRELSKLRGDRIAMVFQSPLTSLNPLMRVGKQIAEPLRLHQGHSRRQAAAEAVAALRAASGCPIPTEPRERTRISCRVANGNASGSPSRWRAGRRC